MKTRKMICAGRFYPASFEDCKKELDEMFGAASGQASKIEGVKGGIVPHAGWVFSGETAAEVFEAIYKSDKDIDTFIIFGACHCGLASSILLSDSENWQTPLGEVNVDKRLADQIEKAVSNVQYEEFIHSHEHSIEVNVPMIKYRFPKANILPIIMPSGDYSAQLGTIAEIISNNRDKKIAIAGSTDLTHYGRDYGFTPAGEGENGIKWAKDVNDKAIIKNIEEMDSKGVVETARSSASACGPYAVAATITLCKKLGANKVTTLNHTHSSEIMTEKFGSISSSSVGYAGIIFSKEN